MSEDVKCAHCGAVTSAVASKFGEFHYPNCPASIAARIGNATVLTLDEIFEKFGKLPEDQAEPAPSRNDRAVLLDEAEALINGPRHADYGDAAENFDRIAHGWSEILGHDVTRVQVALCMDWLKTCRLITSPDHRDSWIDKLGYSALGGEVSAL